jgi:hypothetical protein
VAVPSGAPQIALALAIEAMHAASQAPCHDRKPGALEGFTAAASGGGWRDAAPLL